MNKAKVKIQAVASFSAQGSAQEQEDAFIANRDRGLFVIADGFGGPGAGDFASKTACDSVMDFLKREAGDEEATFPFISRGYYTLAGNVVFNAMVHANRRLMQFNKKKHIYERGGVSLLAAYLDGEWLALANAGLCSAWLLRGGRWVEVVRSKGYARSADPFYEGGNGLQDVPLMSIGTHGDIEPEVMELKIQKGDLVILQTDGLGTQFRPLFDGWISQPDATPEALMRCVRQLEQLSFEDNSSGLFIYF